MFVDADRGDEAQRRDVDFPHACQPMTSVAIDRGITQGRHEMEQPMGELRLARYFDEVIVRLRLSKEGAAKHWSLVIVEREQPLPE